MKKSLIFSLFALACSVAVYAQGHERFRFAPDKKMGSEQFKMRVAPLQSNAAKGKAAQLSPRDIPQQRAQAAPKSVAAAEGIEVDGIYYIFDAETNTATVTYRGSSYSEYANEYTGEVVIPETVDYEGNTYRVTVIGISAFDGCYELTSITIPNSVISIENYAFWSTGISSVEIPNSVTSIGTQVFSYSNLNAITIPESVTYIANNIVSGCSNLETIVVASGNTTYHSAGNCLIKTATGRLIAGCKTSVIPNDNTVTTIGYRAFYGTELTSVTIPNSVTSIGSYAFSSCANLTSVTIPNSVTMIGEQAFSYCTSLTSVTIPESVTELYRNAFIDCTALTTVNFNAITCTTPDIFETDESNWYPIFLRCSNLTTINIGDKVTVIPDAVFSDCENVSSITIPERVTTIGKCAFNNCTSLTSVTIPETITEIGRYAFGNCTALTIVNFNAIACTTPDILDEEGSVYSIFQNCNNLTTVNIGNQVTVIPDLIFSFNESILSVTIGKNVVALNSGAFHSCTGLTSIEIPESVSTIGEKAFVYCTGLTSMAVKSTTPPSVGEYAFDGISTDIPVTVPCGASAAYRAAEGWSAFTNYQESGFEYDIKVASSDISMGQVVITQQPYCGNTMAVIEAVPTNRCAFVRWSDGNTDNPRTIDATEDVGFEAIFESLVAEVGGIYYIFDADTAVVTFRGNSYDEYANEYTGEVVIPETVARNGKTYRVTAIDDYAFIFCSELTSIEIPNSVIMIDDYAFYSCTELTSVIIPNSVTTISYGLFAYCTNLTSVTIPESVTTIEDGAFSGCTSLSSIIVKSTTPPSVDGNYVFYNIPTDIPVTVPCGASAAYQAAEGWSAFTNYQEAGLEYDVTITSANPSYGTASVVQHPDCMNNSIAVIEAHPNPYYAFVSWSDGNTENPRTITVTDDVALQAIFECTVNYTVSGVSANPSQGSVVVVHQPDCANGSEAVIEAQPIAYHRFVQWNDGNTDNPRTVLVTGNITFEATFECAFSNTITVTSADVEQGTVTILQQPDCENNAEAVIVAIPNEGYKFKQWSDNVKDNPRRLTVSEDMELVAYFELLNNALEEVDFSQSIYAVDGYIYGDDDMRIYTMIGQDVTHLNGQLSGLYLVTVGDKVQKVWVK